MKEVYPVRILEPDEYKQIRTWMYRNARPLELARWQYHFENGNAKPVLETLAHFQNEDGGFGNALEPDLWNPASSPYVTEMAIDVFRELDLYDPSHPMVKKALEFLDSGAYFGETGWLFTIPSNSDHPHAPWWTYSEETNRQNGYHTTGGLTGYILRCDVAAGGLYHKALSVADGMMDKLLSDGTLDIHEVRACGTFLNDVIKAGLENRFDVATLRTRLCALVNASIERDPAKWPFYSMRPTQFIDSKKNPFYPGNEAIVETEMDVLLSSRNQEGVWNITWKWEEYPREFAISERWWQGYWAIRNLLFLRQFGRFAQ